MTHVHSFEMSAGENMPTHTMEGDTYIIVQSELLRHMLGKNSLEELTDTDFNLWVEKYSTPFNILINGHSGSYSIAEDTPEAKALRELYYDDEEEFYRKMIEELKQVEH